MGNEILYKFAEDKSGKITHINTTLSEMRYFCPECNEPLIVKKGNIRQHHFAHKNNTGCSGTGEGYLHKTFKKMLFEILRNNIFSNTPIIVNFQCNICKMKHNANILMGIIEVKDEYNLTECRPDIVLINQNNQAQIIIEIVDKHEPEKNVINYCTKNQTVLIRIKLDSIEDLENVINKIQNPTNMLLFNQLHCPNVINYIKQQQLRAQMNPNIGVSRVYKGGPRIDQIQSIKDKKARQLKAIRYNYAKKGRKK